MPNWAQAPCERLTPNSGSVACAIRNNAGEIRPGRADGEREVPEKFSNKSLVK